MMSNPASTRSSACRAEERVEAVALRGVRAAVAFGLARLLREALVDLHVPRGCQQDRLRVVTQGELCHVRPWREGDRKRFPFREDELDVRENKFC